MRVIECDLCGEALSAANDEDLADELRSHVAERHADAGLDGDRMREIVDQGA